MATRDKMSLTNPTDFQTLLSLIPKNRRENVWLFPIRSNRKNPEVPSGTILKANNAYRLSPSEAIHRLKWGSNVGIYAIYGGLMFLDLDISKGKLLASQSFLDALDLTNKTLTIKTRNGGFQYYFLNDGLFPNQVLKENNITIGELRTDWYYVVSVGSFVNPDKNSIGIDGTYRIIRNEPISQFQAFGDYFKKNEKVKKDETITFSKKTKKTDISLEEYDKNLAINGRKREKMSPVEFRFLGLRYGKP
jgi:hypothetical protein